MTHHVETPTQHQVGTAAPIRLRHIVVGVDGSPNSLAALRWAVGLAARDGAKLEAVCAYHPYMHEQYPFSMSLPPYSPAGAATRSHYASPGGVFDAASDAHATLEHAMFSTFGHAPVNGLVLRAIEGSAREVLVQTSAQADLLVVGARGHSGALGIVLGSTAQACTRHATCAVLVVPADHIEVPGVSTPPNSDLSTTS
jgi:nucleotide-binding universal stress UspA family protein